MHRNITVLLLLSPIEVILNDLFSIDYFDEKFAKPAKTEINLSELREF